MEEAVPALCHRLARSVREPPAWASPPSTIRPGNRPFCGRFWVPPMLQGSGGPGGPAQRVPVARLCLRPTSLGHLDQAHAGMWERRPRPLFQVGNRSCIPGMSGIAPAFAACSPSLAAKSGIAPAFPACPPSLAAKSGIAPAFPACPPSLAARRGSVSFIPGVAGATSPAAEPTGRHRRGDGAHGWGTCWGRSSGIAPAFRTCPTSLWARSSPQRGAAPTGAIFPRNFTHL